MAHVLRSSVLVEKNRPNLHRGDIHRLLPPRERFIDNSKLVLDYFLGRLLTIHRARCSFSCVYYG